MKKKAKELGKPAPYESQNNRALPLDKIKQHKEYITFFKDRFGENFNRKKVHGQTGCTFNSARGDFILSDKAFKEIRDKYDRAYELTQENLEKYLLGKKPKVRLTRRNYLKFMGLVAASVSLPYSFASCSPPCTTIEDSEGQAGCAEPGSTDEAIVSLTKGGASIEDNVRRAVSMAGGLNEVQAGDSILIKPNCVWPSGAQGLPFADKEDAPVFTNPEVVRAVIKVVKERTGDPQKIFIGDEGAYPNNTLDNMIMQGIYDVAIEEGVNVLPFEEADYVCYQSDKSEYLDYPIHISSTLSGFDHLINVPVLKNHEMNSAPRAEEQAQYTCCIKSMVGVMLKIDRNIFLKKFHERHLPNKVAEVNLCRPYRMLNGKPGITMNIVDATSIIVSGGPYNFQEEMVVEHPEMIIASKDRVACDTVALSVLRHYGSIRLNQPKDYIVTPVWDQKQIIHAAHLGLGIGDPNRIQVIDNGIEPGEMSAIMTLWHQT